jgi:hypothetical protein
MNGSFSLSAGTNPAQELYSVSSVLSVVSVFPL